MIRSYNGFWLEENGVFFGVNLGWNFVSEHEWGINDLKEYLNVLGEGEGFEKRRASVHLLSEKHFPVQLHDEGKEDGFVSLYITNSYGTDWIRQSLDSRDGYYKNISLRSGEDFVAMWSGKAFMIRGKSKQSIERITSLYKNLKTGSCAIWLGGGNCFSNSGLNIAIIDLIPKKWKDSLVKSDRDHQKLQQTAEKTGIKKKIDEYNEIYKKNREVETGRYCYTSRCDYFALKPSWKNGQFKTKYPVVFWLNPQEQHINNYGWFTVEELEQWLEGKGPILDKSRRR